MIETSSRWSARSSPSRASTPPSPAGGAPRRRSPSSWPTTAAGSASTSSGSPCCRRRGRRRRARTCWPGCPWPAHGARCCSRRTWTPSPSTPPARCATAASRPRRAPAACTAGARATPRAPWPRCWRRWRRCSPGGASWASTWCWPRPSTKSTASAGCWRCWRAGAPSTPPWSGSRPTCASSSRTRAWRARASPRWGGRRTAPAPTRGSTPSSAWCPSSPPWVTCATVWPNEAIRWSAAPRSASAASGAGPR